ncbi:hypothetical protein pb186bvf_001213 [Paramecium bursaria]
MSEILSNYVYFLQLLSKRMALIQFLKLISIDDSQDTFTQLFLYNLYYINDFLNDNLLIGSKQSCYMPSQIEYNQNTLDKKFIISKQFILKL